VFEAMGLWNSSSENLSEGDRAERLEGADVTHDFARVLGIEPVLGRMFTAEEDRPGGPRVVMLGNGLWKRRFGGAPNVVGRTLRVNSAEYTVIGVLPVTSLFPGNVDIWMPLQADPNQPYQSYYLEGVARLKPGVTVAAAREALTRAHTPIFEERDSARIVTPVAFPLREQLTENLRTVSLALGAAVAIVLLIACANVASLMLARSLARHREMGIRMALGAGSGRLMRQLFTENLLFSFIGGAVGLAGGYWASRLLVRSVPDYFPTWVDMSLDVRVVGFSIALATATAVLFGWAPAIHSFRGDLRGTLHEGGARTTASAGGRRTLAFLVAGEVALSAVLLVGGGLLLRAFQRLQSVDPGFSAENVLTFALDLPSATYDTDQKRLQFWETLMPRLAAMPGVAAAGAITCIPLGCHWGSFFDIEGRAPLGPGEQDPVVLTRFATPGYFAAMGIRLKQGRFFEDGDGRREGNHVAIVNESFVRQYWPNDSDPIGNRFRDRSGSDEPPRPWVTVVGVVRDIKHYGLGEPMRPGVYRPITQNAVSDMTVALLARSTPSALADPARQIVREQDPDIPVYGVGTMEESLERSMALRRTYSWLLSVFATVALLLAVGGIYGVTSYAVTQRVREIGIRVALGARTSQVMRSVIRSGMSLVAAGLLFGLLSSLFLARRISTLLFGVQPDDVVIYGVVAAVLMGTALVANLIPARRAARIEPMASLRDEG
jgi:putative ABC transport system permease protein